MSHKGNVIVVRKPYNDDMVIPNLISYVAESLFVEDDIYAGGTRLTSDGFYSTEYHEVIEDFLTVQATADMKNHRRAFHIIISIANCKNKCRFINSIAEKSVTYFLSMGYQCYAVPHGGSEKNMDHYHVHVIVNPISFVSGQGRLYDKNALYYNFMNYLSMSTHLNLQVIFKKAYED